jgi:hypothetical protein
VIVATAFLALSASACGGSSGNPATTPGGQGRSLALEFSACMRAHGVSKFPDLTDSGRVAGELPKLTVSLEQLGVSSAAFQTAENACRHLLPNGGRTTPAASQRDLDAMREFARCMRSHGVPTWPDPTNGPAGWGFNLLNVQGFDPNSPQTQSKMNVCQRELPAGIGIPLSRPG